jgi:hypothetical protein
MSKHVPGPWLYNFESDWIRSGGLWVANCGKYIIHAQRWDPQETYDFEKNARLIAAAPLMYETLQAIVNEEGIDHLGQLGIGCENTEKLLNILRMIRGEE